MHAGMKQDRGPGATAKRVPIVNRAPWAALHALKRHVRKGTGGANRRTEGKQVAHGSAAGHPTPRASQGQAQGDLSCMERPKKQGQGWGEEGASATRGALRGEEGRESGRHRVAAARRQQPHCTSPTSTAQPPAAGAASGGAKQLPSSRPASALAGRHCWQACRLRSGTAPAVPRSMGAEG